MTTDASQIPSAFLALIIQKPCTACRMHGVNCDKTSREPEAVCWTPPKTDTDAKTATFIRDITVGSGSAALYRMEPPHRDHYDGEDEHELVIAFAYSAVGGPETYLFGANEAGVIADWGELSGSVKGTLSHDEALTGAGYEVIR